MRYQFSVCVGQNQWNIRQVYMLLINIYLLTFEKRKSITIKLILKVSVIKKLTHELNIKLRSDIYLVVFCTFLFISV